MLKGRSNEAEGRQMHCHGCRMVAQWLANGHHMMNEFCLNLIPHSGRCFFLLLFCLLCASFGQPKRVLNDDCGNHCSSIPQPWQPFSQHMTMVLPFSTSYVWLFLPPQPVFQGRHTGRCSSYTETRFFGFRWPLSVPVIFLVTQRCYESQCRLCCIVIFIIAI